MSVQSRWIVRNFEFAKYWHITADISYFLMRSGNFYQSADYKDATVQPDASWALVTGFTFISSLRTQTGDTSRIYRLYCTSCNVTPVRVPWQWSNDESAAEWESLQASYYVLIILQPTHAQVHAYNILHDM